MFRITSITEQKSNTRRRKSQKDKRFNIYLNEKYAFSIGEENLIKLKLKEGQNIQDELISKIKKDENQNRLLEKSINYISYRPRSEKELRDYLIKTISKNEKVKWTIAKESDLPNRVISKLTKYGYINDVDFTKWWVQSRTASRPRARRIIELELAHKGISKDIIKRYLPQKPKTELELALKVLEKKKKKLETFGQKDIKRKIYYYLTSRGFDFDVANEAFAIYTKKR